jgi:hypothetical protein
MSFSDDEHWFSTISFCLTDADGDQVRKRFLLTNRVKNAFIFESSIVWEEWLITKQRIPLLIPGIDQTDKQPRTAKLLVTLVQNQPGVLHFPAAFYVLNDSEESLYLGDVIKEKKIPSPVLTHEDYKKLYDLLFPNKLRFADCEIDGRMWLRLDGVMGTEYFSALGLSEIKEKLTDKIYLCESDYGVLLMQNFEKEK